MDILIFSFMFIKTISHLIYAILLNIWFIPLFGAIWGIIKWLNGHRIEKMN